jgi:hypothetical protein
VDLAPTLLDFFGQPIPKDMQGKPLKEALASGAQLREAGLFGIHGGHVNMTDGRYVYMRAPATPENAPLYQYTHMPTHMRNFFSLEELRSMEKAPPFPFSKGCPLMKIRAWGPEHWHGAGTMLFDLEKDPAQEHPIQDPALEQRMIGLMTALMRQNDCPPEQFERLGLSTS